MNDVIRTILERRSHREFSDKPVAQEDLEQIVQAGLWAPSGMASQSPVIVCITDPDTIAKLSAANARIGEFSDDMDPFYGAPAVLVVLARKEARTHIYDGSCTLQNMMLAAQSLGLGSIWVHRAKEEFELPEWQAFLSEHGLEGEFEGIGHCCVGYAKDEGRAVPRLEGRSIWV